MPKFFKDRLVVAKDNSSDGWFSRGYFPHFDGDGATQHVSFHLFDALPQHVLARWREELKVLPEQEADLERRKRIQDYLDSGYGACFLRDDRLAEEVEKALMHFDSERYALHAWCVMPNHVHTLFTPEPGFDMSQISHSWKSFTANQCNKLLGRSGKFGSGNLTTATSATNNISAIRLLILKTIRSRQGCAKSRKTGAGVVRGGVANFAAPLGTHRFQRAVLATDTFLPEGSRLMLSLHAGSDAYPGCTQVAPISLITHKLQPK